MNVTLIYDNTSIRMDLQPDWGFAALVEAHGRSILFDTGARGSILLENMNQLGMQPKDIDSIFISHHHFDHTGGLSAFLDENSDITLWRPPSFRGVNNIKENIPINSPRKIAQGLFSTGELDNIEHSLCVTTDKGIVVIAGCCHPPVKDILAIASQFGPVYGLIGGLHGTEPEALSSLPFICATHCTQKKEAIRSLYPDQYVEGGAGTHFEIS